MTFKFPKDGYLDPNSMVFRYKYTKPVDGPEPELKFPYEIRSNGLLLYQGVIDINALKEKERENKNTYVLK